MATKGSKPAPRYETGRLYTGPAGMAQYRGSVVTRSKRGEGTREVTTFEPGPDADRQADEYANELQRETRGYKAGGMVRRGYGKARGA